MLPDAGNNRSQSKHRLSIRESIAKRGAGGSQQQKTSTSCLQMDEDRDNYLLYDRREPRKASGGVSTRQRHRGITSGEKDKNWMLPRKTENNPGRKKA